MNDRPVAGIALMTLAMACFSGMDGASKLMAGTHHWAQVAFARYVFQLVFLLPLILAAGPRVWRSVEPGRQVARGLGLMVSGMLFIIALSELPIADASAIGFVSPLMLTALAVPMLGEHVGWRRWTAVLVGFAGVLIVVRPGLGSGFGWAAMWPVASAAAWAMALVLTRKMRAGDRPATTLLYTAVVALAVSALAAPFVWQPAPLDWWLLAALMGAFSALGQYLIIRAFQTASAAVLAPLNYSQMVWSTLIGLIVFDTWPDGWTWLGTAVIIGSGIYIAQREAALGRRRIEA
jgi:drug/metabolite transporter (DMT)-like permease